MSFLESCPPLSQHEVFPKPPCSCKILQRSVVHDTPDGADPGGPAAPLTEPLVLPRPDQVHPAAVVRVLVEDPVAVGDVAGKDVVNVEAVHDAGAVIGQVHHLASELDSLVQAHAKGAGTLVWNKRRESIKPTNQ